MGLCVCHSSALRHVTCESNFADVTLSSLLLTSDFGFVAPLSFGHGIAYFRAISGGMQGRLPPHDIGLSIAAGLGQNRLLRAPIPPLAQHVRHLLLAGGYVDRRHLR